MANHIILNDCLFGYPESEMNGRYFRMVVMAVDVQKGGDPTLIGKPVLADGSNIRIPTKEDYKRFKVKYQER